MPNAEQVVIVGANGNAANVDPGGSLPVTVQGGSSIIGTVAIDQSTPGTTNGVVAKAGQNNIGNVGGKTVTVSSTPTLGGTAYGINYSVGGIQSLAGAFTSTGSGVVQSIVVNCKKVETNPFYLVIFKSAPANAIADNAACNINSADFNAVQAIVPLTASSVLGTQTTLQATSLGIAMAPGTTALSVLLVCGAAMTNNLAAGDVGINVTVMQDV